ncbi:RNA 2'-phosphotransferase [Inquilinus sp.]|jgi:putative RNA 2'-phosphotransferase|uniref:RNA 2'-phosphotransferase n=1 Tax=Inquilinus sp. TaxID=1932117 RepID=UPI0037847C10
MADRLTETSKFLSYVLRHEPQAIGLTLDSEGWARIDALIAAAAANGKVLDRELIQAVVDGNDKKRFSISPDGDRMRAVQGHSTAEVAIAYAPVEPPEQLFHGTATRFLASIRAEGLVPGSRHHVHLSPDVETAMAVGRRHGQPVVLTVAAGAMHCQGFVFHRADNGVWLTKAVPPAFLGEMKGSD